MLFEQSQVKGVSFSATVPGMGTAGMGITTGVNLSWAAQKTYYNYHVTGIDTSFIDQMSIRLLAGKNFDATTRLGFRDTTDRQLIVNMETLRLWEIKTSQEAIGKRVDLWGYRATIRAVVDNYHYDSPKVPHIPIIHLYSPRFDRYASVKFAPGDPAEQLNVLKRVYEANFPYSPFTYFFLDSEYDKQYKTEDRFRQVFGFLTIIAVVISCLGLFGLATFTATKRTGYSSPKYATIPPKVRHLFLDKVRHQADSKLADFGVFQCEFSEFRIPGKGRFLTKVRHLFLLKVRH